ncbi:hypothetical protein GGF32_003265 [Allomyces javanicus]|nr:hypothetical protein GGF32_003265 [Allomyces javanicus]
MSTTPNRAPPPTAASGSATSPRLSPTQFRARKQFWESVATTAEHEVQDALSVSSTPPPPPPRARSRRSAPAGWNYLQPDGSKRHEEQEVSLADGDDAREDGVHGLTTATAAPATAAPAAIEPGRNLVADHDADHIVQATAPLAPVSTQKRRRSVPPAGTAAATPVRRSARIVAKTESTPSTLPETPAARPPPRRKASISPAGRSRVRVRAAAAAIESSPAGNTRGRSRSRKRSASTTPTPASLSPDSFKRRRAAFESTDPDPTPLPPAKRARRSAPAAIADSDTSLFATRAAVPCAACARDVYRREAVVLGGTRAWHPACFVCADCRAKAGEGNTPARLATALAVVVDGGVLVCAHHAMDRMRRAVPATAKAEVGGGGAGRA